jgi:hypothetical protein
MAGVVVVLVVRLHILMAVLVAQVLFGQRLQAEQRVPVVVAAVLVQVLEIQLHLVVLVAYTEAVPAPALLAQRVLPLVVKVL